MSPCSECYLPLIYLHFFLIIATLSVGIENVPMKSKLSSTNKSSSVTSVYIFGDSTVDPGNNNNLETYFKGNHPPYGIDLPHGIPIGRFTNGRITTDFIASYAGIKDFVPPYLDPNLSFMEFITGVSFASAGAGYDPSTAVRNEVIDLGTQLQYFDDYKRKLKQMVGKEKTKNIIKHAAFVVSCGTNDIVLMYGLRPWSPHHNVTISSYLHFLVDRSKWFLQELKDRGARRIAVVGLPPLGCLPIIITLHKIPFLARNCISYVSNISKRFNQRLQRELKVMQASQQNITIAYGDVYAPLQDQINNPHLYGFEIVDKGCCGTGEFEGGMGCNNESSICNNRSEHLFWDSMHPTERSYYLLVEALRPVIDLLNN